MNQEVLCLLQQQGGEIQLSPMGAIFIVTTDKQIKVMDEADELHAKALQVAIRHFIDQELAITK